MNNPPPQFTSTQIAQQRPAKNAVDAARPYAFLVEPEAASNGQVVDVATVFLTNSECPFHCLMCDLWKNTTDQPVPPGAIPQQIDFALDRLPAAEQIKLYNSGNFFDAKAIPRSDYQAIARRVRNFDNVIVENHPRLCTQACVRFQSMLDTTPLEIAMGLETVHPEVLPALNKQMTLDDYARAVSFLLDCEIAVRSFILLKPPFLSESEGIEWALRSLEFAFALGVGCCAVIPTRAGNGVMDRLESEKTFAPPTLDALEQVMEQGLSLAKGRGRVFVDLWDVERFADCQRCVGPRRDRLHQMNLSQQILPAIPCNCREERQ